MERRNTFTTVLLVALTFGIYGLVWLFRTTRELADETGRKLHPALDVGLAVITLGAWGVWACYRNAEIVHDELTSRGVAHRDRSLPVLVFGIATFATGLSWLAVTAILQDDLNELADELHGPSPIPEGPFRTPAPNAF
ncbi:MAG: DUF4234 domain-containing protein [Sandaracinus sp.]|nr:DUF4234 domain-containing protein [Sandaracinus sp.]MCB9616466.1 DUF4234 domain-containing protein [Sandaracinus sp.]MCB9633752.1 DUF4234 domain-containing protein [Sandaracinus sp.]